MQKQTPQVRVLFSRCKKHARLAVFGVFLFIAIFSAIAPHQARAATSSTINFQARLMTSAGSIVPDGTYNVEFKLYSASSGGTALWTEDYLNNASQGLTVKNGYLSTNLGSVTSFPGTINWNQDLWMTMTVRGTGSCAFASCTPADAEMSPRLKLTAVPYAFKAGDSATLGGIASSGFIQNQLAAAQSANLFLQSALSAGSPTVQIQQASGQTGDLLQFQNSSAQSLSGFNNAGQLYLGRSSGAVGSLKLYNATNANTVTVQSGTTSAGYTLTLPTALGSSGNCLTDSTGTGVLAFSACSATAGATSVGALSNTSTANGGSISGGVLTLNVADGTNGGLLSAAVNPQTIGGAKTFSGAATFSSTINTNTFSNNTLTFGDTTAGATINSGTGQALTLNGLNGASLTAAAGSVTLSAPATSSILIGTTNSNTITLGTTAATSTITVGRSTTTNTISIGSGNTSNGNTQTINIGAGTPTGTGNAQIVIGNANGASAITLSAGTGGVILGNNGVANTLQIGNTTGAVTQTINVGNNATASSTTNTTIGSTIGASATTIQGGTGDINLVTNASGASIFAKSNTNNTAAFQVLNSSSNPVLTADTANGRVGIGNVAPATLLHAAIGDTSTLLATERLEQTSTGYASLEFKNPNASFFVGQTTNANGNSFIINSSTAATPIISGTISHVQSASTGAGSAAAASTISKAFTSNIAANNLIVAAPTWAFTSQINLTSCSDTKGNTYTVVVQANDNANNTFGGVCYAVNTGGAGADTVTATFSSSNAAFRSLQISEYSGAATTSPVDVFASNVGTASGGVANSVTSTSATTTANNDLIYGVMGDDVSGTAGTLSVGTGFTQRLNGGAVMVEDKTQASPGSVAATFKDSLSNPYYAIMVAFKPATSSGTLTDNFATPIFNLSQTGALTLQNSINSSSAFRILSVAGTSIFNVDTNSSKITINNSNVEIHSGSLCVKSTAAACAGSTAGTIYATSTSISSADYAENYVSSQSLHPGDVIKLAKDGNNNAVVKTTVVNDNDMLGVVSTNPGITINSDAQTDAAHPYVYPIALSGRVPVKVSTANGAIHAGDFLVASAIPGVAMKATAPGYALGRALENYTGSGQGTVMSFVGLAYYNPSAVMDLTNQVANLQEQVDALGSSLNTNVVSANTLYVSGTAYLAGDIQVAGVSRLHDLQLDGHVVTSGITPQVQLQPAAGSTSSTSLIPAARVTITGTDTAGTITVIAGSDPGADALVKLIFNKPFAASPQVVISPVGKESASLNPYIDQPSAADFLLGVTTAPLPAHTYRYTYHVIQ